MISVGDHRKGVWMISVGDHRKGVWMISVRDHRKGSVDDISQGSFFSLIEFSSERHVRKLMTSRFTDGTNILTLE